MNFFCLEIFDKIFRVIFLKYFKNFTMFFSGFTLTRLTFFMHQTIPFIHAYYISLSLSAVGKPVKGNNLLLCMNSIMYLLLT